MKQKFSRAHILRLTAIVLSCAGITSHSAKAATATWTGSSSATWSTSGNWSPASAPSLDDTAIFSGTGNGFTTINLGSGITVGNITFTSTAAAAYTIGLGGVGSQTLTLENTGSGTISIAATVVNNQLINANLVLGDKRTAGDYFLTNDSTTSTLTLAGTVSGGPSGGSAGIKILNVGGAGNTSISGIISNGGATAVAITKTGAGTLTLSGANAYTGVTTINGGVLSVAAIGNGGVAGNLGQATNAAANLVFGNGALRYTGATATTDRAFTITAGQTATFDITSNNLTVSGASANTSGALTKIGAGTLTLSGTNAYTGLTTVTAGTLAYGVTDALSSGAVAVNGGTLALSTFSDTVGAVTISSGSITSSTGVLTGTSYSLTNTGSVSAILAGAGTLTKSGAGTSTLSGANTYTGTTTIRNGTVVVGVSDVAATSGAFGNASSAILLTDASSGSTDNVSLLINGAFTLGRNISVQNNATAGVTTIGNNNSGNSTFGGTVTLAKDVTLTSTGTQATFNGIIGGTGNIHVTGTGTVQFHGAAANTYVGTVYVDSGTLNLNKTASGVGNQITGNVEVSSGATLSLSNNGSQIADSSSVTVAGTLTMNASNSDTIGTLTVTGGSVNTSSSILTLSTAGTQLTMNGGTILLGSAGTAGKLSLNGNVAINSSSSVAAINTQSSPTASTVDLNAATRTFNVATGTGAALGSELNIAASVIGNAGVGLTKTGAGTMVLSGGNTYTGITSINDGTLVVDGSTATGSSVNVASIAKLFGTGTIGGAATILGTQSSGASGAVGTTQTFSSSLTYSSGSIFEWDIDVATNQSGETHDKLVANSLLGSGAQFKVLLAGGDSFSTSFWSTTHSWTATDLFGVNNAAVNLSNIFTSVSSTGSSLYGSFSFTSTGGANVGNQLSWTAVPEPTSALAGILLGAGLLRRKRTQRQSA